MFKKISTKIKQALLQCQNEWEAAQIRFEMFHKIEPENVAWNNVATNYGFNSAAYLLALQQSLESNVQCRYIIVYENELPQGIAYFQLINLKDKHLNQILNSRYFESIYNRFNGQLAEINFNDKNSWLCICGNLFVSGPYGFVLQPNLQPLAKNIFQTMVQLVEASLPKSDKIFATVVKDLPQQNAMTSILQQMGFIDFAIDPDMILDVKKFGSYDTYIQAFTSKYRVRANSALQKLNDVTVCNMDAENLLRYSKPMATLLAQVIVQAPVHLASLKADYFHNLKCLMPDNFFVTGYFYNGQLVAFTSTILSDGILHAHLVGFEYSLNKKLGLYQNMLYQLVKEAITINACQLHLGRDAMEIKSTIGATPVTQKLFIKFGNSITHFILDSFTHFSQPKPWVM
ncbi:MAG TPA: GNAT family N-acetyltransferase, partial [Bacteroidia bacterium]|nr:GNAT family N-acetyltransferase [Bacteroidia bacterium]